MLPHIGESESDLGDEEEVNSVPQAFGQEGEKVVDDVEGVGDSHEVDGKKADGKDV